jgi:hypothetical protein
MTQPLPCSRCRLAPRRPAQRYCNRCFASAQRAYRARHVTVRRSDLVPIVKAYRRFRVRPAPTG